MDCFCGPSLDTLQQIYVSRREADLRGPNNLQVYCLMFSVVSLKLISVCQRMKASQSCVCIYTFLMQPIIDVGHPKAAD